MPATPELAAKADEIAGTVQDFLSGRKFDDLAALPGASTASRETRARAPR